MTPQRAKSQEQAPHRNSETLFHETSSLALWQIMLWYPKSTLHLDAITSGVQQMSMPNMQFKPIKPRGGQQSKPGTAKCQLPSLEKTGTQ